MAEITDLVVIDANNTARWPEGMPFNQVNNSARADEGMLARWYLDTNGALVASGSSNNYSVTANRTLGSLPDKLRIAFTANFTNTGAATLNVSGLGALPIVRPDGSATLAGDIVNGAVVAVVYIAAIAKFQLVSLVGTAPTISLPVGSIMAWPTENIPAGTLECNGQAVSRTTYAALFAAYGSRYGNGDGSTTFNLPDYRGYFMRGHAAGSANDPDRASRTDRGDGTTGDNVGTKQADDFKSHTHGAGSLATDSQGAHTHLMLVDETPAGGSAPTSSNQVTRRSTSGNSFLAYEMVGSSTAATLGLTSSTGAHTHSVTSGVTGSTNGGGAGNETRAKNIYVKWIVVATPAAAISTFVVTPAMLMVTATGVNMNAVADTTIPIALPPGFTRYRAQALMVSHASTDLTAATAVQYALFTGAGGTGTALVAATVSTVSATAENTLNNLQSITPISASANVATLYFRVTTAHGSAAAADVTLFLQLLP